MPPFPLPIAKAELEAVCRAHRVRRLWLFGSATDGGFDPARSDYDFLVEFEPHPRRGFDDVYFTLRDELRRLTGRDVDLVEAGTVANPFIRDAIERTKAPLYVAA